MHNLPGKIGVGWLREPLIGLMISEAKDAFPAETGGVLVGYWARAHEEVVITDAVGPGPQARHRENRFIPDPSFHFEEIARLYEESGRLHTYLGDWHTHPLGSCTLSRLDRLTLKQISRYAPARSRVPVMLILAGKQKWNLGVWCYFPRGTLSKWRACVVPLRVRVFP